MLNQISSADFRALNVFQCVAECGSFSNAQNVLNVNESTISSQISGFEKRIGFRLCTRGRAGFMLTERGKVLLQAYSNLNVDIDHFRQTINTLSDETVGSLRLGFLDHTITETGFSTIKLINRFINQAPKAELRLIQDIQSVLYQNIVEERLDLALGVFDGHSEMVKSTRLYTEEQFLYCGNDHPMFNKTDRQINLKEIEQSDWVKRGYQLEPFQKIPVQDYNSSATAANIESVAVIILAGKHIGFLPSHYAQRFENEGKLRKIKPNKFNVKLNFSLISKVGKRETLAIKLFREICMQMTQDN